MADRKRIEILLDGDPSKLKAATMEAAKDIDRLSQSSMKLTEATKSQSAEADAFIKKISLVGVGVVGAAAGMMAAADKAIEATARFKDLGLSVGLTAEQISKFETPAALAGVKIEQVTGALQRLSHAVTEVRDPTSQAASALRAFNIDAGQFASMRLDQQFEMLARESERYAGSAEKNAALMALTGRSGAELQKIFQEIAATTELLTTVTDAQAEAADALQDKWALVKLEQSKTARDTVSVLTPSLTAVLGVLVELKGASTAWSSTMEFAGGVLRLLTAIIGSVWLALQDMGDALGATGAKLALFFKGDWDGIKAVDKARDEAYAKNEARFHKMWEDLQTTKTLQQEVDNWDKQGGPKVNFDPKGEAEARRREKEAALALLREEALLQKNRMENLKAEAAAQQEFDDAYSKHLEAIGKSIKSLNQSNEMMKVEIEALGLTRVERELLINTKQKEVALDGVIEKGQRENISALYDQRAALIAIRAEKEAGIVATQASKQSELDFWNELADRGVRAIGNLRGAISDLLNDLKNLFAKKLILQLGATLTGSSTLANAAAGAGGNSLAGAGLNAAGSYFGSTAIGSGLSAAGSSFMAGFTGTGVGTLAPASSSGIASYMVAQETAAAGGMTSAGSMMAAAAPYILAALAAYALYKAFASPGGGPKTGGSFQGIYGPSGALTGTNDTNLFGLKPNESTGDANAKELTANTANAAYALIRNLGGKSTSLQFGLGYDSDPAGTAQNRIKGRVTDANGNLIFNEMDREIGRDGKNIGPEMQLTASRMILAAVKGSDLPAYLAKVLDGVVIETASQTEIDAVIKKLSETKAAWDGLTSGMTQVNDILAQLGGDSVPMLKTQMAALAKAVDDAQAGFDIAAQGADPIALQAAQASLMNAVITRYNTEKQAIADIQASLVNLKQSAYEFNMANAARINRYGGNVNIGAIASGRLNDLQGTINTGGTPEETMANVNSFLGAVDDWVSAESAALQSNASGQSAIAAAMQSATQARIAGLQKELALAQQWAGILNSAQQAIDKMRLSTSNPSSTLARQALAGGDVNALLGQYRAATGASRVELANQLMSAVGTRQQLNEQAFQRPSDQYLAAYNDNMAILSEIKLDAKTEAEKQTDLQSRIEQLTQEANGYAAASANAGQQANGQLDAIYAQARGYAEWAQVQYNDASAKQEKILNDQLMAITGGMEVGLYQAKMQTEMREILSSINTQITAFMTGAGAVSSGGNPIVVNPVGGGNTGGGGDNIGTGGGSISQVQTPLVIKIGDTNFANATLNVVTQTGRVVRQTVEQS